MENVQTQTDVSTQKELVVNVAFYDRITAQRKDVDDFSERESKLHDIACRKFGKNGYHVIKRYRDLGYTGMTMNRPALTELLNDAENSDWEHVIAISSDRISRNIPHATYITNKVHTEGKSIVCGNDSEPRIRREGTVPDLMTYYHQNLSYKRFK